jgi:hypothetical protein
MFVIHGFVATLSDARKKDLAPALLVALQLER